MITSILKILTALINVIERLHKAKKKQEKQAERDALEDNPDLWFNQHFNGVRDKPSNTGSNKTNTTDSKE